MNPRSRFAAVLLAFALLPRVAAADVSDADRATARALTLEGYEALDRKDYATAADLFKRADSLFHVPTVALGLAHAEVGLGKLVSALATYSRIMREGVPPGAPLAFTKALDDARREIDVLTQRIPRVILVVHGAGDPQVTIDGVAVPAAAIGVDRPVDPGAHVVRATAAGCSPWEARVTLLEGKVETIAVDLVPDTSYPAAIAPVAPVVIAPVAPPPLPPPPAPVPTTQRNLGFVGLGLGGAGLAVGAVTGGLAIVKHGDLVAACPGGHCLSSQQATLGSEATTYSALGAASTAGFIAGGVLAATGLVLVLTAPSRQPQRGANVVPVIGLGYAGAAGRF